MSRFIRKYLVAVAAVALLPHLADARNLVYNGSFEAESAFSYGFAQNWKMNDPDDHGDAWGSAARENWRAKEGEFLMALRGTWAETGDFGGVWQEAEGRANQAYRLTAWFWTDEAWTATTQEMKLEFWNWDRTELLGSATLPLEDLAAEWRQRELNATSPDGTEWVRVVFNVSGAGQTGALQLDDVVLELAP
ncbi:MAG TPA: hypothetical protein PKE12_12935 [Kiritimatiellia bacterium]|nr:hypothetical protein [Kiritimatiellia bacterium]